MRTQPWLRYCPSSSSVWIGVPLLRSGMPWKPIAAERPCAKRVMFGSRKDPDDDIVDFENTW